MNSTAAGVNTPASAATSKMVLEVLTAVIGLVIVLTVLGVALFVGPSSARQPIVGTGELEPEDWADYGDGRV